MEIVWIDLSDGTTSYESSVTPLLQLAAPVDPPIAGATSDAANSVDITAALQTQAMAASLDILPQLEGPGSASGPPATLGRKGKSVIPECAISLRRSARVNKYDGFRVPPISDSKAKTSKVKPRVVPSAPAAIKINERTDDPVPPPTPYSRSAPTCVQSLLQNLLKKLFLLLRTPSPPLLFNLPYFYASVGKLDRSLLECPSPKF